MADEKFNPRNDVDVMGVFRKAINEHKSYIRISVLEELIESCYGPQALLNGRKIVDVIDFKEWLEAKLQEAREEEAKRL
jgi:hypothetical protein